MGDSDLAGTGQAQVTFSTSSSTNRVTVTLNETTHPGLFRGFLTLVGHQRRREPTGGPQRGYRHRQLLRRLERQQRRRHRHH